MRGKANQVRWVLCTLCLLTVLCPAALGRIMYVDGDATGANDGSSWADAFNYLQDALITASAEDEIRIAEGTYKPNQGLLPFSDRRRDIIPGEVGRLAAFGLKDGLIVKGGFAGFGESDPNERNPEIYKTILSGDLDGNDVDMNDPRDLVDEPTRAENSYNVLTIYGDVSNIVLDGLIIKCATKGGLVNIGGNPRISNCVFTKNSNDESGGAIVNINGSMVLTYCRFAANSAAQHGGAAYSDNGNDVFVECNFVENSALDGTGIVNIEGSLELESCTFSHHSTYSPLSANKEGGGAIFIVSKKVIVKNCLFNENVARYGGAMVGVADVLTLEGCVFKGNSAEIGGAIYDLRGGTITNSIFADNQAEKGGAICGRCIGPNLIGCTLFGNSAQNGNAISWYPCLDGSPFTMSITNCILRNGGDEIDESNGRLFDNAITYSNIQDGWPGEGNFDLDPLFADTRNGDFHLKSQAGRWDSSRHSWIQDDVTSPCVDAGDPNSPIGHEPFPNGGVVNMGAYGGTPEASKSPTGLHAKYGGGTGELNDPYLIYTAEQMNTIGIDPNDWDKHFKLMADIDLSAFSGTDFNLIGESYESPFNGLFDGNGHTIYYFTFADPSGRGIGLISHLGTSGCVRNLILTHPDVEGQTYVGSIVGYSRGVVQNCRVVRGRTQGVGYIGGIVGISIGTGLITGCHADVNVSGYYEIGGIAGANSNSTISFCSAAGWVAGRETTGGITGRQDNNSVIHDCQSVCSVSGTHWAIGGLLGRNHSSTVSRCNSTGSISGDIHVGGLIGYSYTGDIRNSFWDIQTSG